MRRYIGIIVISVLLTGCASFKGRQVNYTCPVCGADIQEYYHSKGAKTDKDSADSKSEPFVNVEIPLNKIGG